MEKTCVQCSVSFEISSEDRDFIDRLSPDIAGKKYLIPSPSHCVACMNQRRFAFRNDQNYYRNTCMFCNKAVVSIYSPDKPIKVACQQCFWSDAFDPLAYGRDFDFSRPFFEQYAEMRASVPRIAIYNTQSENSDYTVHSSGNKNCYMSSSLTNCEDVFYSDYVHNSKDSMDCLMGDNLELCYECLDCRDAFNCDYCQLCSNVSDCYLCFDCKGSQNLVGCVGVRHSARDAGMILNQLATVAEVRETVRRLNTDLAFRRDFIARFEALKADFPKNSTWNLNTEQSVGNFMANSKNVYFGFYTYDVEDGRYVFESVRCQDVMHVSRTVGQVLYDVTGIVDLHFGAFCSLTYQSDNMYYCDNCQASSFSFGCVSLKKNRYCILNKQYTQQEYEELVPRIIEHMARPRVNASDPAKSGGRREPLEMEWGEFFPIELSPFGYNETKAFEWFPLDKDQVWAQGWHWSDYESPLPQGVNILSAVQLPEGIADVLDDILDAVIICESSGKPFRIIPAELAFYRKKGLVLPRRAVKQRHYDRNAKQPPRTLVEMSCQNCGITVFAAEGGGFSGKIYCEECYLKLVY